MGVVVAGGGVRKRVQVEFGRGLYAKRAGQFPKYFIKSKNIPAEYARPNSSRPHTPPLPR